jgi:adenylate kinase family enzyme
MPSMCEGFQCFASPLHFRELILEIIKEGRIVPSEITVELIRKAMEMNNAKRVLIDGFPRCEENRIAFERIVSSQSDFRHCIALIVEDSLLIDLVGKQIQVLCGSSLLTDFV